MAITNISLPFEELPELPATYFEPCWYAAYTCANHEKSVAAHLEQRNFEHYLPQYETVHRWKDRRVRLSLPLFPGYVFVRLALRERLKVLQVPSIVKLVGFGEYPEALKEGEIETLRNGLAGDFHALPHPYLTKGRRVRIKAGPLTGLEGILLRRKGNFRVVISVDLIMRSIAVDIDAADVLPLATRMQQPAFES
jgi:transcription antitermination factor NusG